MELLEALHTRRSVRRYRPDPVPDDTVRAIFRLPNHVVPLGFAVLGWPAGAPGPPEDRFRADRVHRDRWPD